MLTSQEVIKRGSRNVAEKMAKTCACARKYAQCGNYPMFFLKDRKIGRSEVKSSSDLPIFRSSDLFNIKRSEDRKWSQLTSDLMIFWEKYFRSSDLIFKVRSDRKIGSTCDLAHHCILLGDKVPLNLEFPIICPIFATFLSCYYLFFAQLFIPIFK